MRKLSIICMLLILLLNSCDLTRGLKKARPRANISLPLAPKEEEVARKATLAPVLEFTNLKGEKTTYARTEKDKNGKEQITVELKGVTVVARSKNIPERCGKVDIDFVVSVPSELFGKSLQLTLTPNLFKKGDSIAFDDLVFKGKKFDLKQKKGYRRYLSFLSKIVPDSLYSTKMLNRKKYHNYIYSYNQKQKNFIVKDSLLLARYDSYLRSLSSRHAFFNKKRINNKKKLASFLNYELVKERYNSFSKDTTNISDFYEHYYKSIINTFPQYNLERNINEKYILRRYRKSLFQKRLVKEFIPMSKNDSLFFYKKSQINSKIAQNEYLKSQREKKYKKFVLFPKNEKAKLDSIVYKKNAVEYYYHQSINTDENSKKMQLVLHGNVLSTRGDLYTMPVSDTLSYSVSSMLYFLDLSPRFKRKIIERKAMSSVKAYITFPSGKSIFVDSLKNNKTEIAKIKEAINNITQSEEFVMDSLTLSASSSPEGNFQFNLRLSKDRAYSFQNYIKLHFDELKTALFIPKWVGEDWLSLSQLVRSSSIYKRDEILSIMSDKSNPDTKEIKIREQYPSSYAVIRNDMYPKIRAVDFTFHLHRKGMIKDTIHTTEPDTVYAYSLKLMEERKYSKALNILNEYSDWNTAICLMSLGYDEGAYNILVKEKETADKEYLLAILSARLGREEEAVKRYLHSCELDSTKKWRGALDPEINKLIKIYSLDKEKEDLSKR